MTDTHKVLAQVDTVQIRSIMHPLVAKMLEKHDSPADLKEIMALQRDWEKAEAKRAFDSALVELKRALPHFLKHDKAVEFGGKTQYTHTTLAGAMDVVTPMLVDHGFSLTWTSESAGKDVKVTCELTHRQGHTKTSTLTGPPDTSGHKNPAQAIASTVTIFERYTALGLLGLSTKDMGEIPGEPATPTPEKVDTSRNMRAMADLQSKGKTKVDVEKFLGKPLAQWTTKDLDKLRAWIAPAAATATPAPDLISKAEADELRALMVRWSLTADQMGPILVEEIGRKPINAADIRKPEFEKIKKLFDGLELGAFNLVNGKIERPPDEEPVPVSYPKSVPEDENILF